jgi:hypothetical protein
MVKNWEALIENWSETLCKLVNDTYSKEKEELK